IIDFSGFPQHIVREEILEFSGSKSRIPFDLGNGPLYRIYLLKETKQSWFFIMIIHHIIFDGFSRRIFIQELNWIYNNLLHGINETTELLKYHSYDFVGTEKDSLSQEDEMESIGFWKEYLKDCPPGLKFPYDHLRTNVTTGFGYKKSFQISPESSHNLRKISQECGTSLFKTLLSILGILFNKYTGDNDICIGIPVSNRRSSDFKTMGFFVDTIPFRMVVNEETNLMKHIITSSELFRKTLHYKLPFDKIVRAINPERITGLNPFYQISFSWLDNLNIPMQLGHVTGKRITIPLGVEPFDITFYMWENDDVIEGEIQYNPDLFKPDTIIRLLGNLIILIDKLLENKEISIKFLSMISAQDLALIERINDTRIDYPKDKTIISFFKSKSPRALMSRRVSLSVIYKVEPLRSDPNIPLIDISKTKEGTRSTLSSGVYTI
ncbi:condensation domain-containing protein, partial [Dolichospermum sp. ST_sed3]|nr:condensation domain-containing protein [Dolichospermum sp. ST_sed3]